MKLVPCSSETPLVSHSRTHSLPVYVAPVLILFPPSLLFSSLLLSPLLTFFFRQPVPLQDNARQAEYSARWLALDVKIRGEIKDFVLRGLHSEQVKAGAVAAQSVSAIATVELPQGQWPDLIEILLRFVNTGTSVPLRQSTLSAIGYICESLVRPCFPFFFLFWTRIEHPKFRTLTF
jgi:hypothetical protein